MTEKSEISHHISIAPLLNRLVSPSSNQNVNVSPDEIASALALVFEDRLSPVQCASLLTILHLTQKDRDPLVIARCAQRMRQAAAQVDLKALRRSIRTKSSDQSGGPKQAPSGSTYRGGLCDIVGTGGDGHSTYNVSTTASIVASSLLLLSKHGNRASSSKSGSADLLQNIAPEAPVIEAITATTLPQIYSKTNYAFLFAPLFHPGMRFVAPIRKDLGFRTIFNILGPLANPVEGCIEARVVGVARRDLGLVFAEALRISGARKAMVVCGAEDLDEISCAGMTHCWRLVEHLNPAFRGPKDEEDEEFTTSDEEGQPRTLVEVGGFNLEPEDFGVKRHPLNEVCPGKSPKENAEILIKLLQGELPDGDPVLDFVLINTAALFVVAGVCDADSDPSGSGEVIMERGPAGGRWKEGVRRARWAIKSGAALKSLKEYIAVTRSLEIG
ncbi:MAG: anthranilate phosphoribosyltransferase [Icmadophila ericetorum]|nr:anthranilate phosphoribosyltransferase [Icmadophila ericetorum]